MADGRSPWMVWALPAVAVVVFVLSNWAWRVKPPSTLEMRVTTRQNATLSLRRATDGWACVMAFTEHPPHADWVLHEGVQTGLGYELHWIPDRLAVQLVRSGDRFQVLASAVLPRGPRELRLERRNLRINLSADGAPIFEIIDLLPAPAAQTFGFEASAELGEVVLSMHLLTRPSNAEDRAERELAVGDRKAVHAIAEDPQFTDGPVHAIARVREAVMAEPAAETEVLRDARLAVRALGDEHEEHGSLVSWLGFAEFRAALAKSGGEEEAAVVAEQLATLADAGLGAEELPGILLRVVNGLVERAAQRPSRPVDPALVFAIRRRLLDAVEQVGTTLLDGEGTPSGLAASEQLHWCLRLVTHAASSLAGRASQPTPAEGPVWVAARWRAFSGLNPRVQRLPDAVGGWKERNPLGEALERLTAFAGLEPLAAVGLREAIIEADRRGDPAAAMKALDTASPEIARYAAIARAILVLRWLDPQSKVLTSEGEREQAIDGARRALAVPDADGMPLSGDDPLGFALDLLLAQGQRRRGSDLILPGVVPVPEGLRWADRILDGRAGSLAEVWRVLPDRPLEGIAAALVMQEIVGGRPDWSLLDRSPCFTVPLRLLVPTPSAVPDLPPTPPPAIPPEPVLP